MFATFLKKDWVGSKIYEAWRRRSLKSGVLVGGNEENKEANGGGFSFQLGYYYQRWTFAFLELLSWKQLS